MCRKFIDTFEDNKGDGLVFIGATGTGKTYMAMAIICELIANGYSVKYMTQSQLFTEIRSVYSDRARTESSLYKELAGYDLLVIDEIGIKKASNDEMNTLFRVFDERYMSMKSTVIITNLKPSELESSITSRILDRAKETSLTAVFDWPSLRA